MANKSLMLLCEAVLEDHFGYYVKCVAHELLNSELSLIELRKALKGVCKTTDVSLKFNICFNSVFRFAEQLLSWTCMI